jgi:DNA-binding NtrC family response regulator
MWARGTVAVLNGLADMVELWRIALESRGFVVVSAELDDVRRGLTDLKAFLEAHDPKVIIFDITPPYERSWQYLDQLRRIGPLKGRKIVLTTTNERRLRELVSTSEPVIEVFGKPFDLELTVEAVERAAMAGGEEGSPSPE